MNKALIVLMCSLFAGCATRAYYPAVSENEFGEGKCDTLFKKLELNSTQIKVLGSCGNDFVGCTAVAGIVVPVTTFLFSSGYVVFESTLGWIEYQGRCSDSFINSKLSELADYLKAEST